MYERLALHWDIYEVYRGLVKLTREDLRSGEDFMASYDISKCVSRTLLFL